MAVFVAISIYTSRIEPVELANPDFGYRRPGERDASRQKTPNVYG
jgi:hypothetical protein